MARKRWIIGGGLATLALASTLTVGTALANDLATPSASDGQSRAQTFIDRLADNLGLSSDQVRDGIQTTQEQLIDEAVASGKITAERGEAMKERIESGEWARFPFGRGFMRGWHAHFELHHGALADALGLTTEELRSALSEGRTLQEIITDQGKTVDEVVDAVAAELKTDLDQAVADGRLTQEQADQRLDEFKQRLTNAINNNTIGLGKFCGPEDGDVQSEPSEEATPTLSS